VVIFIEKEILTICRICPECSASWYAENTIKTLGEEKMTADKIIKRTMTVM